MLIKIKYPKLKILYLISFMVKVNILLIYKTIMFYFHTQNIEEVSYIADHLIHLQDERKY